MKPTLRPHQTNGHSKNYSGALNGFAWIMLAIIAVTPVSELYWHGTAANFAVLVALLAAISLIFLYVILQRRLFRDEWIAYIKNPDSRKTIYFLAFAMALGIGMFVFAGKLGGEEDVPFWAFTALPLGLTVMHTFIFSRFLFRVPGERKRIIEQEKEFKVTDTTRPEDELTEDDEEWREN